MLKQNVVRKWRCHEHAGRVHHGVTAPSRPSQFDRLGSYPGRQIAYVTGVQTIYFGKEGVPETVVSTNSQETPAEMVGTTRSRVSFFMNRFRKLGLNFVQDRTRMHGVHSFPENLRSEHFRWADLVQET